jgi:hypothetical protein
MPQNLAGGVEDAQQIKARPKRKQVKSACLNCRKRKTGISLLPREDYYFFF